MQTSLTSWLPGCCLALSGAALISLPGYASPLFSPSDNAIQSSAESLQFYVVELSAALTVDHGKINPNALTGLKQQQEAFIDQLYTRFNNIEVQSGSKLLANTLRLKLTATQALAVSQMAGVKQVSLASAALPLPAPLSLSMLPQRPLAKEAKAADTNIGAGVSIALISTGIDYTHASLGGTGTKEAYQQAWQYAGVPFDGFPTSVVTKGWDFFSEREPQFIVADINPLDSALDTSSTGGRGTALASIIHQLAPAAKLWAGKIYRASRIGSTVYPLDPNTSQLQDALEWALDPNRDGDTSDRADIIVLDVAAFGPGFYTEQDVWIDTYAAMAKNIQKAASLGSLVLVPQGIGPQQGSYMTPIQAIAPAALAVGTAESGVDSLSVAANSLHGPVRGDVNAIKPDLVGFYTEQQVALVGSGDAQGVASDNVFALAHAAAMAAALKGARPQLNGLELKALLMNTANNQLSTPDGEQLAAVSWVGAGLPDVAAAAASPAVAWELATGLPSLHLGNLELLASEQRHIQRELYIRNLSDKPLTYTLSTTKRDGGPDAAALSWQLPSTITVPANRAVTVPVTLSIDGRQLTKWPLINANDYTAQQWRATEMDGYLTLKATDDIPDIQLPWLVRARPAADIQVHFDTYREQVGSVYYGEQGVFPLGEALFPEAYTGREQEFENTASTDVTFTVLPVVARNRQPRDATVGAMGGMILQNLASAVIPEGRCEAGRKLTLAVTLFKPRALPFRSYFDTAVNGAIDFIITRGEVLTNYPDTSIQNVLSLITDRDLLLVGFVELDENGVPQAYYQDIDIPINPADPRASLKISKLPVRFATDSRNLLVDYCLDELARSDVTEADFNQNLGYMARTDRDALPTIQQPFIPFNPVNMGPIVTRYEYDWFGNLIEVTSNQANHVALSAHGSTTAVADYVNEMTLAPGERATVSAVMDGYCEYAGQCGSGFVLMAEDADFHMWSSLTLGNDHGFIAGPRQGQQFNVLDNAESGQLVGTIQLESDAFFNLAGGVGAESYELRLMSPLPDNALRVTRQGEIFVDDASALNADGINRYHLKVYAQMKDSDILLSSTVEILVTVSSSNVSAPVLTAPSSAALTATVGSNINVDLSLLFNDAEDDLLTFSAAGLAVGLQLDSSSGKLSGSLDSEGSYPFTVTVSDGRHATETSFTLTVNAKTANSSGGSFGGGLLLLLLATLRRRTSHPN